eukprot:jgi/Mesen1/9212/ME000591S08533
MPILFLGGLMIGVVGTLHFTNHIRLTGPSSWPLQQRLLGGGVEGQPSAWHYKSDEELFVIASAVSSSTDLPVTRAPKLAFLFLTRGPLPLAPLWSLFFAGHEGLYSVYIHAGPDYSPAPYELPDIFRGRHIPSQPVTWGHISMVDAERRLLANALLDPDNARFVLVSETCVPLYNFSFVHAYLVGSPLSFVAARDDPGPYGRGRWNAGFEPEVALASWRKGAQWFEVNRELAAFVVADVAYHAKFRAFCVPACYVDEHYLSTVLSMRFPDRLANRSVTWTDWSRGGWHPASFSAALVDPLLLGRMRGARTCAWNGQTGQPCFLFARKLQADALPVLMKLAPLLGLG